MMISFAIIHLRCRCPLHEWVSESVESVEIHAFGCVPDYMMSAWSEMCRVGGPDEYIFARWEPDEGLVVIAARSVGVTSSCVCRALGQAMRRKLAGKMAVVGVLHSLGHGLESAGMPLIRGDATPYPSTH